MSDDKSSTAHQMSDRITYMVAQESTWHKLRSTVYLFLVLAVLGAVGFVAYKIAMSIAEVVQAMMEKQKRFKLSAHGATVRVRELSIDDTIESAQRFANKAFARAPDAYKGKFRFREQPENATAGVNGGWA